MRRFLGGGRATLPWNGLAAHRSNTVRALLHTQRSWLVVERLPAYAPELNPVGGLWSSLQAVEFANLTTPTLAQVIDQPIEESSGSAAPRTWHTDLSAS